MLVLTGQVKIAGETAGDRIVVELERVAQPVEIALDDAEASVDLLSLVVAGIAERK